MDRFGPEKFRKNWSTFWRGPLFSVGPVGILVEWIAPISWEIGLMTRSWQNKRPFAGFSRVLSCSPYLDADCSNLPMIGWNDFKREKFVLQIGISSQIHLTFLTSAPDQLQLSSVKFPFICVVYSCALCMKCLTTLRLKAKTTISTMIPKLRAPTLLNAVSYEFRCRSKHDWWPPFCHMHMLCSDRFWWNYFSFLQIRRRSL